MSNNKHSSFKHGMRGTRLYSIWIGMKTRCSNKNHTWYKHYGGRGIGFHPSWSEFINFMNDMHDSYKKHVELHGEKETTLERINSNLGYSKENCRWATRLEQSRNARNNIYIEYKGERKTILEWANKLGIRRGTLYNRIFVHKLTLEDAFTPVRDYQTRPRKKRK